MSSSPIEAAAPDLDPRTARRRGRSRARRRLKRFLPKTLFGRSLLILITPLILVQAVATSFFYDRLWDTVLRRLSSAVAGEIELVIETRAQLPGDKDWAWHFRVARNATELRYEFIPGARLPPGPARAPTGEIDAQLARALAEQVAYPTRLSYEGSLRAVVVAIALEDGVLRVTVPESRLWSSTSYIFIIWITATAIVTLIVATFFLRNQVRSLRRLAVAAEAFGKGRDVPHFRPEGAAEVRQAAAAFLLMRERIQRQITQRTEMLAGVSHDLRTPLTRMRLELELLGDGEEILGLRSDVAEMQQMIENYLDFARGEGSEQAQLVDLVALIAGVVANARRDGAEATLIAPPSFDAVLRPEALRRAVANLVGNAGRYGSHIWVTLLPPRRGAEAGAEGGVEIIVDDDGPGIPVNEREAVFRPFLRLEGSRNRETGGIGLGLAIARDVVRGHGGEVFLETSPQGGLRARIYLPR